jgi:hypothetical protein
MAQKKVGSQIANLTSDHLKLGIALIFFREGGVPHTVGKILTRAKIFL